MAKKKPSNTRKRAALKDLAAPARGIDKVKGGALLLSTQQLQDSTGKSIGAGQPPDGLRKQ